MPRSIGTSPTRDAIVALLVALGLSLLPGCASVEAARLYESGTLALERGEVDSAVRDLERAATLVPEASEIHNHLGLAYTAAGRESEALAAFAHAVALDCDNDAARHNLEAVGLGGRN